MNKFPPDWQNYVCCPACKAPLRFIKSGMSCRNCKQSYSIKHDILQFLHTASDDLALSEEKWNDIYKHQLVSGQYARDFSVYKKQYFDDTFRQLNSAKKIRNITYLEIGCGPFFMGQLIARHCKLIIGIDISPQALSIAKAMLDKNHIKNYLLIQGDILNMPVSTDSVDLIYGGGVIEHFKETQKCVNELHRVLKPGGVSFNSVPMLNIGSLTYRQVWGNIPNAPVLKQIAEFIHLGLLKSKHMTYGYEYSFLPGTMRAIHRKSGFKKVTVSRFDVKLVFEFLPEFLRAFSIRLAQKSPLFWPMIKIIAIK